MKSYTKFCKICLDKFVSTGPAAKFCSPCGAVIKAETSRKASYAYKLKKGLIQKPGVGQGNNQGKGESHHSFTTGLGCYFQNVRRSIKEKQRYCQSCSKDLATADRYGWCVHHKDHDRTNNVPSNLELLCKRCHQVEHRCHLAFSKTCND